ncbi:sporulation protein YunB [Alicyclobacillus fodiniaquatilis]|uniref:Sporulation protein YunB n=1 Tax=Alicyclobacillus fodiniaquatilis TaxID=1661150 RepID=A0ABW4JM32_9BACL
MARRFRVRGTTGHAVRVSIPRWLLPAAFVCAVLLFSLYMLDHRLRPSVMTASTAIARRVGAEALNDALTADISAYEDDDKLLTTTTVNGGKMTLTRVNMTALTQLQAIATKHAQASLQTLTNQTIRLPIVQMFSGSLISRSTFTLPVRITVIGSVHSKIDSDVESKGVNQVVHIVYLDLTAQVMVVSPFVTQPITIETKAPVAYVVMAGQVPNAYYGAGVSGQKAPEISSFGQK